jgi:hypothetical protein
MSKDISDLSWSVPPPQGDLPMTFIDNPLETPTKAYLVQYGVRIEDQEDRITYGLVVPILNTDESIGFEVLAMGFSLDHLLTQIEEVKPILIGAGIKVSMDELPIVGEGCHIYDQIPVEAVSPLYTQLEDLF